MFSFLLRKSKELTNEKSVEGKDNFPQPAGNTLPNTVQDNLFDSKIKEY